MTATFSGVIKSNDVDAIVSILRSFPGIGQLQLRDKLSGEQISCSGPQLRLECFRSFTSKGTGNEFLMEGAVMGDGGAELIDSLGASFARGLIHIEVEWD
jgi:hypothetical protein